jgi:hypothetical protein
MYYLPFYLESITLNQVRYQSGVTDSIDEEEDFESEFQTLIVQVLSLMSTLMTLSPKLIYKDLRNILPIFLMTCFLYSLKSPFEQEKFFTEDKNTFLADFLMETSIDYESMVSIRSTVIDLLDEAFQHSDFNKSAFENAVAMLAMDNYTAISLTPKVALLQKIQGL